MSIAIDSALAVIVVIFAVVSAKRGFVSSLIGLAGIFLSMTIAFYGSIYISDFVFDKFVGKNISQNIIKSYNTATDEITDKIKIPEYIGVYSEKMNIDIKSDLNSAIEKGGENAAPAVVKNIIKPAVLPFIRAAALIALFFICCFIFSALARLTRGIRKIPLVGGLNSTLGAILGAAKGVIVVFLVCFALSAILSFFRDGFWIFTAKTLDKSYIYNFIINLRFFKIV